MIASHDDTPNTHSLASICREARDITTPMSVSSICSALQQCNNTGRGGGAGGGGIDPRLDEARIRLIDQSGEWDTSSVEDTRDEVYMRRHLVYEQQERNVSMRVYLDSPGSILHSHSCLVDYSQDLSGGIPFSHLAAAHIANVDALCLQDASVTSTTARNCKVQFAMTLC